MFTPLYVPRYRLILLEGIYGVSNMLDTNVLVSALITKGTPPDQLYQAWLRNKIELVTSAAQIDEVSEVLSRPRLRKYVDLDEAAQMLSAIHLRAIVIHDMPIPMRSPDPKDDAILVTAVAGDAQLRYPVTNGIFLRFAKSREFQSAPRVTHCKSPLIRPPANPLQTQLCETA